MKKIPLTKGKFALVDDADFDFLSQWKWYSDSHGYARRSFKLYGTQHAVTMHRALLNPSKRDLIDHINSNRTDNRRANLRLCTKSQNAMNRQKTIENISGYKGVYSIRGSLRNPWAAKVQASGRSIYLGLFPTPQAAAKAYNEAAIIYHGEYAKFKKI